MDNKENKGVEDVDSCSSMSQEEILLEDSTPESTPTVASSSQEDDDIVKEEEELHKVTLAKEEETKHLNEERMQNLAKDGCYERLKFLLTNCVHYTSHLHRRMEEQRMELARAIEKQRAQNAEKDLEKKAKLAASKVKWNKGSADVARGARSSSRLALQETVQRNSPVLQSGPTAATDSNNNAGSKKRRRTQSPGSSTTQDTSKTLPKRKRAKISEEQSTIPLQGDSEQEPAAVDTVASDMVDGVFVDSGNDVIEKKNGQPLLLTGGTLRKYQMEGYKWLQMLYENAINGILADEMGLGKTIQCIALICELVANGLDGPFLICGPLSTLPNWVSEFTRFAPKIPSILYHGSKSDRLNLLRKISQQQKISAGATFSVRPVVITSFEIAMNDRQYLSKFSWKLLIVDEGHRIKNSKCRLVQELKQYNSAHRLLLTGTPLQNNMAELWSLLNFLIPEIFDNLGSFETWFDAEFLETVDNAHEQIIQEEQRKHTLSMLHQILQPFVLRRLKCDVEIIIPPKRELLVYAPLIAKQQEMYRSIVDRSIRRLVEGPPLEEQCENIECNERGRPIRKVRKNAMDLKLILDDEDDDEDDSLPLKSRGSDRKSNASEKNAGDDDDDVEKWAKGILSYHQEVSDSKKKRSEAEPKALVNVQLRNLMALLRRCCNHPYLIEYPMDKGQLRLDEEIVGSCGKLMLLDRMLIQLIKDDHKVLIFSQMTMMLNILEDYLSLRGYGYSRLDGSMSMATRQEEMKRFAEEKDVPVFLLSTRAGGLGINLTQADTVIIYDSDWNPQCDLQAQDRCHRIGQVRPVMVYRLVTANTVDQRIVERATAKRKLEKLIMHKGKFKSSKALGTELLPINPQELLDLLKETDYTEVAKGTTDSVISDEDLRQLLDRSDLQRIWSCRLEGKTEAKEPLVDLELKGVFKVVSDVWDEPVVKGVGVATADP